MTQVTPEEVRHLAKLSKIKLSENQVEKYAHELERILEYVSKLQGVDTTDIKPTSQVTGLMTITREDEVQDYKVTKEQLLDLAPDQQDGYIKVRRVL